MPSSVEETMNSSNPIPSNNDPPNNNPPNKNPHNSGPATPVSIILVLGLTGAGKSTFINVASGSEEMKVGHSQESCTTAVAFTKTFLIDDNPVVLIDTPGFDNDVDKGLEDVLIDVEAQINRNYKGRRITGIIYIHAMDQRRVSRATKREIQAVRVLCGNEPKNSFIIATTMWKEIDASVGVQREEHLKTDIEFFKQFTDMGVKFVRHPDSNGEQDSARNIIRTLLSSARTQATNADAAMNENESSRTSTRSSIAQLLRRLFGKVPSNSSNQSRYTLFK